MRISDWSSDVCSSDLHPRPRPAERQAPVSGGLSDGVGEAVDSAAGEAPDGEALGGVTIRPAALRDVPAIQAIYAHPVLHGTASFAGEPPAKAEIARHLPGGAQRGPPDPGAGTRPARGP